MSIYFPVTILIAQLLHLRAIHRTMSLQSVIIKVESPFNTLKKTVARKQFSIGILTLSVLFDSQKTETTCFRVVKKPYSSFGNSKPGRRISWLVLVHLSSRYLSRPISCIMLLAMLIIPFELSTHPRFKSRKLWLA